MEPFVPGHIVECIQDRDGKESSSVYICVDYHQDLYLLVLSEEPFHGSHVHIAAGQEDQVTRELFVLTNALHQTSEPKNGSIVGCLGKYGKGLIAEKATAERALLSVDKDIIRNQLLCGADVFYYDKEGDPD